MHRCYVRSRSFSFFFFNDTATTEIYTLSLHDALPISEALHREEVRQATAARRHKPGPPRLCLPPQWTRRGGRHLARRDRSEEHTSELQSRQYLVCRLLLEKKKKNYIEDTYPGHLSHTS